MGVRKAAAAFPAIALQPVSLSQVAAPVCISNAGDGSGRLFICDQGGQVRIIKDGMLLPTPFLDLTAKIVPKAPTSYVYPLSTGYDERGLLSIVFHPNFNKTDGSNHPLPGNGKFYVFYSAPSPNATTSTTAPINCRSTISEFAVSANANVADATSERVVLAYDKPQSNHNGGQLQFGPDGYLYISAGDGGSQHDNDYGHTGGQTSYNTRSVTGNLGNAQDTTKLLGKLMRIDPLGNNGPGGTYGIPFGTSGNPFAPSDGSARQDSVRAEIYAFGFRNPWRFSFDDGPGGTNRLFEGDVGQNEVEEVNVINSGGNYGWRVMEGGIVHDSTTPSTNAPTGGTPLIGPIAQYAHINVNVGTPALPQIGAGVIGGYVYRGTACPDLASKYVFGDFSHSNGQSDGTMLGLEEVPANSNNWVMSTLAVVGGNPLTTRICAFGRDEQGELYVATRVTLGPLGPSGNGTNPDGGIYKIVEALVSTTINPVKDNSIYADFTSNSNAIGSLYAGNNGNSQPRRALLAFDVANNVPSGATVTSAVLNLHLNQSASPNNATLSIYPLNQNWGEGSSTQSGTGGKGEAATTGDATWLDSYYAATSPTPWGTAGGSYSPTASASATVGSTLQYYTWSAAQMATDVQSWLTTPASNFGWILLGDETASGTARVFDSREAAANVQPTLQINYNPVAPPLSWRLQWLQQYYPTPGTYVDDLADPDADGIPNLLEYAFNYSPLAANPPGSGVQVSVVPNGASYTCTTTFRRDPRATDLTYVLQTSDDMVAWTTVAQSALGATPTGSAFVSEADVAGQSPVKLVTSSETVASPAHHFARLQVTRSN